MTSNFPPLQRSDGISLMEGGGRVGRKRKEGGKGGGVEVVVFVTLEKIR